MSWQQLTLPSCSCSAPTQTSMASSGSRLKEIESRFAGTAEDVQAVCAPPIHGVVSSLWRWLVYGPWLKEVHGYRGVMTLLLIFWHITAAACALCTAVAAKARSTTNPIGALSDWLLSYDLKAIAACPDRRNRRLLRMIAEGQSGVGDKLKAFYSPTPKDSGEGRMLGEMVLSLMKSNQE